MSNKIIASLLITTFGLTVAIADDDDRQNIVIPAYSSETGAPVTDVSCSSLFDPSIMSDPGIVVLAPVFEVNVYDCPRGQYLPAGGLECVECPSNSYCGGGEYAYDYYITQGLDSCPAGEYAPSGSQDVGACGRMFHIGNASMYLGGHRKTTPSLNFDTDHDGVADLFANMTLKDVPMSNNTTKSLKVTYHGEVYSVYDNTIDPDRY